jgi:hypothetical protein
VYRELSLRVIESSISGLGVRIVFGLLLLFVLLSSFRRMAIRMEANQKCSQVV